MNDRALQEVAGSLKHGVGGKRKPEAYQAASISRRAPGCVKWASKCRSADSAPRFGELIAERGVMVDVSARCRPLIRDGKVRGHLCGVCLVAPKTFARSSEGSADSWTENRLR